MLMKAEHPRVEDAEIDLREMGRALIRRWRLIAGTVAVGLAMVVLYLLVATPLYTATTSIMIDPRSQHIVDAEAVLAGYGSDAAAIDSQVELIRSPTTALRVADRLKLASDRDFSDAADGSLLGSIWSWFSMGGEDEGGAVGTGSGAISPERAALAAAVLSGLQVQREGRTYVLSIRYTAKTPVKAARIANAFANEYLVDQLEARFEATKLATDWLNERLATLRTTVQAAENAVELYKQQYNLVSAGGHDLREQQLAQLNQQLVLARADVAEKKARLDRIEQIMQGTNRLEALQSVLRSDVIGQLRTQQSLIAGREAELSTRYGARHPQVINVRAQRADIERQINLEINRIVANIRNDYEVAVTREQSLLKSLEELQGGVQENKAASVRLRELEREANANRALYEAFLGRFKEVSQQETLQASSARIIAEAAPPPVPSFPNKKLILAIAFVAFSGVGVGLAFLMEYIDDSFKTAAQVEEHLKLPALATVPIINPTQLRGETRQIPIERFAIHKPLSTYAEAIRALKMEILLSNIDQPPRVVMVTSAIPGEGKTTLSSNLATFSAHTGLRVLLIDADLRSPALTNRWLGEEAKSRPGLVEFLLGDAPRDAVMLSDPATQLHFIPASQKVQNTAEVLESAKMRDWLRIARTQYDLVVIDSSPVTPVVDSRVLAKDVDAILLTVEWDRTPRELVQTAIRNLGPNAGKIAGVALNKVNIRKMSTYAPYGYGAAYGKYHSYYGRDD